MIDSTSWGSVSGFDEPLRARNRVAVSSSLQPRVHAGSELDAHWPRNRTLGHRLADHIAGLKKGQEDGDAFHQKRLPRDQRESIMDRLHREVNGTELIKGYREKMGLRQEDEEEPERLEEMGKNARIKKAWSKKVFTT